MNTKSTGIHLSDLTRLLERLSPLDCDGRFAVAIARLERQGWALELGRKTVNVWREPLTAKRPGPT